MRLADDEGTQLSLDRAVKEFIFLSTGRTLDESRPLQLADLAIPITDSLIRRLAVVGLSTIVYHARRGSLKAGQYLVDRCMGAVEQSFSVKVESMSLEDCKSTLLQELEQSGISGPIAEQLTERLIRQER